MDDRYATTRAYPRTLYACTKHSRAPGTRFANLSIGRWIRLAVLRALLRDSVLLFFFFFSARRLGSSLVFDITKRPVVLSAALKWRPHRDARRLYSALGSRARSASTRASLASVRFSSLSLLPPSSLSPCVAEPGGTKKCAGHVHSSHGALRRNYLAARSRRTRASERASVHPARASNWIVRPHTYACACADRAQLKSRHENSALLASP